jgi:hypothetical protein
MLSIQKKFGLRRKLNVTVFCIKRLVPDVTEFFANPVRSRLRVPEYSDHLGRTAAGSAASAG